MTTFNTGNPIGSTDPRDLYDNAENLDSAVNSDAAEFVDRVGKTRLTLKGMEQVFDGGQPAIAAAYDALAQADRSESEANRSEAAADAATVNADVYADTAAGLSGTAIGDQFQVVSGTEVIRYLHEAGPVATEVARYPASSEVSAINATYRRGILSENKSTSFTNESELVAGYVRKDGQVRFASAKIRRLDNGISPLSQIGLGKSLYGGNFLCHSLFSATLGQSLGESHVGGKNHTLVQIGRSYGYRYNDDTPAYATDRLVAVAEDFDVAGGSVVNRDGESPMFGLLGHNYEMLSSERNLSVSDYGMYRVGANNAAGSTTIAQNNKGTARYNRTLAQIVQEKAWGAANGVPVICPGNLWLQGEGDNVNSKAYYLDKLTELAIDYAADIRAILDGADDVTADQTFDPHLFTYATCGRPVMDAQMSSVPRAQLQAAVDYFRGTIQPTQTKPAPVILTCPTYFMSHEFDETGIHVPATWSYMLGAYGALAIQRMFIDEWDDADPEQAMNKRWPPMHPIDVKFIGNTALLKYQMRLPGTKLQFGVSSFPDGEGVSEQENYGFAVYDTVGAAYKSIATPELVAPDTVAIRLASGSFADGDRIGYAMDQAATNWTFFTGNAGNLRDNHGDFHRCEAMNLPMHNFVSPHFVTKDASTAGWTLS